MASWALLLLLGGGAGAWLPVPVNADEPVVENGLYAGYGLPGFFVFSVLDQCCFGVSTKRHLRRYDPPSLIPLVKSVADIEVSLHGSGP